eukprot:2196253-Lingulodinium_polyedra.AAC.1
MPQRDEPPVRSRGRSVKLAGRSPYPSTRRWTLTGRPGSPRMSPQPGSHAAVASASSSTAG